MTEHKVSSSEMGAHDKLDVIFAQLREKAAKHRKWNAQYTKYDDGSAALEIVFEAPKEPTE